MEVQPADSIITLLDENGNEVDFDLLISFDYEGKRYVALLPIDPVEGVGEDEVVLLEIATKDGEETYCSIDNPILLDEVFDEFTALFDELIAENDADNTEE